MKEKIQVIYVSSMCSERTFLGLFHNYMIRSGQQVQKYHRLLAQGLAAQPDVAVTALSKLPLGKRNKKRHYIVRKREEHWGKIVIYYISYYGFRYIGYVIQSMEAFRKLFMLLGKRKNAYVIVDVLNGFVNIGIFLACRFRHTKMIGIVTDLPQMLAGLSGSAGILNKIFVKLSNKVISGCDGYVLLTEEMNKIINLDRSKPYVVIEGQVDSNMKKMENHPSDKNQKRVCLYAGALSRAYGIEYMVKGFLMANIRDTELHIYGNGDYEDELKQIAKKGSSIRFFGIVPNNQVAAAQRKAALLINPRPTDREFVKYSFPSKNMEYMASGTPMLTTRLPGMPREYEPYVFFIEEETAEGICECFKKILSKRDEELFEYGRKAKQFVMDYKTETIQAQKVVRLLKNV